MAYVKASVKKVAFKRDLKNTLRRAEKLRERWNKDVYEQDSNLGEVKSKIEFDDIKAGLEALISEAESLTVNRNG